MKYLYNETSTKTNVYLAGQKVELPTKTGENYVALDNQTLPQATEWTRTFTNLKIVEQEYVDNLNRRVTNTIQPPVTNNAPIQSTVSVVTEAKPDLSRFMVKPTIQNILNESGDSVTVYRLPVLNKDGEIVDYIGYMFNEDRNELLISSVNIPLKLVDRNKKKVSEPAIENSPVTEKPETEDNSEETEDSTVSETSTEVKVVKPIIGKKSSKKAE